ncbi:LptF/LptG family permease [Candidatus Pelagibacter communis]|uniref:Predicted permease YjgP/YjgQ family protein n=2 Tax=Pelagibacter ubique TaxID=198252 RepID=Q4FMQ6_PELUB|nr:LptF/LptG family permease [Candidatus Pelagibacter ubique]AAZ21533.1 Predicted permease YjgP/YjgQ family protein [Candidatus Pelagibacter ubique HTCC1062]EAS84612.1 Predicted permease YjgP/YjgQ family protein [Candidatus Pelagibacter ubique HTCC1002]
MKTYIKFLINLFNISLLKIFITFFIIILITNILEQIEFFKNIDLSFFYLFFLSLLNTPSVLFEILPFIFLLGTQVFFIHLIDKNELQVFKYSGLNNIKIIKILGLYSFILGIIMVIFFYNGSSILKNSYLLIKNNYSGDNKYLAVITENGLWIKDEINDNINIINARQVNNEFLLNVSITKFNKDFDLVEVLQSERVDITSKKWKIFNPITLKGNSQSTLNELILHSNFDLQKINSLFSNLSSLSIIDLITLRKSYMSLNYSVTDINSHLLKIVSYPVYLTLITIFSAIIMFNIGYQKNTFYKITLGIFLSVIIYYINNFLSVLGTNEKIPVTLSIFLPLIILSIINFISIIKLNEK